MTDLFTLHLILAFIVGGASVSSVTLIAERYGSALGGLVGGLPAISILSFLFIGLNQSASTAAQATAVFPLALTVTMTFLVMYAVLSTRGFKVALLGALLAWIALSSIIALFAVRNLSLSLLVFLLIASFYLCLFKVRLHLSFVGGAVVHYSPFQIVLRAFIGGLVVMFAVLSSQLGGPEFGGIAASFPAIFSLTLYFTNRTRGIGLSRALTKPLLISASLTALPYSLLVGFLYPLLGIGAGTLLALACVIPLAALAHYFVNLREI